MESRKKILFIACEVVTIIILAVFVLLPKGNAIDGKTNENANISILVRPTYIVTDAPTQSPTFTPTPTQTPLPTPTPIPFVVKPVESGHAFKPYTRYTAYNLVGSQQWKLQQIAETDEHGIRIVMDSLGDYRYCVALGTYWCGGHPEHIGRCVDIYMVNGAVLKCVLADVKRTEDTIDGGNRYGRTNGDTIEFIIDTPKLPDAVRLCGNVSAAGPKFASDAYEMHVYDMWIEGFGG